MRDQEAATIENGAASMRAYLDQGRTISAALRAVLRDLGVGGTAFSVWTVGVVRLALGITLEEAMCAGAWQDVGGELDDTALDHKLGQAAAARQRPHE